LFEQEANPLAQRRPQGRGSDAANQEFGRL
jgi:hypothetical protein